jgi:lipopolysaccharide export system protein LptA
MPQDATPAPNDGRPRSRAAFDFGLDRGSAFRTASRHTLLVKGLRVGFPVLAVLMFVGYGVAMQRSISFSWGSKKIQADGLSISREALVAYNPRYTGFDKQGGQFEVKAATAQQDLKLKGIVRLKSIDGKLLDANRQTTTLKSPRGTMDTNTNVLELYERIDVVSQNGLSAELTQATVHTKESRIVSHEPVTVRMPSGTVRGKAMTIEQKLKQVLFTGGVVAHLQPQSKAPQAAADGGGGLRGTQAQAAGPLASSSGPVDITSERLLIDDAAKIATFLGTVVAKQTDQVMETAELRVSYEGSQGQGGTSLAAGDGASKLKRLLSPGNVVLTRGLERATGSALDYDAVEDRAILSGPVVISGGPDRGATADRAEMDNKNDKILLTGNVVVTQQRNVLKGRRLLADRKQGSVNLSAPAGLGTAKGQINAKLYQGENDGVPGKKTAEASKQGNAGGLGVAGLRGDPSQPIDIDADTLDVDDKKKVAIFRGKVKAVQGDYVINTEELVARYSGEGGLAMTQPSGGAQAGQSGAQKTGAQLTQVLAPRRVDIVARDGQRAQGNSAVFNPKTNTARLTGDVVLSHGTSVTNGNCAELDMGTGLMKIIDACGFTASGPGAAKSANGNIVVKGRAQAVFVPGMMKDEQKAQRDKSKAAEAAPSPATPAAAAGAAPSPPSPAPAARPSRPRSDYRENDLPTGFGGNN